MKKLTFVLLSSILSLSLGIVINAHCGSSWEFAPPTFSPNLNIFDCLHGNNGISGDNPTNTTKTVATTIMWYVGQPIEVNISDHGQNRRDSIFPLGAACTRCFPDFFTPQFDDIGNNVTEWSQLTRGAIALGIDSCAPDLGGGPTNHHFGRSCNPSEEQCELEYGWYFNTVEEYCQEDPPGPCNTLPPEFCPQGPWDEEWCGCVTQTTPILVDVAGNHFNLSDNAGGVSFNLNNFRAAERVAWTRAGSDDAWLALDRDGNGTIDDGSELFGSVTPQPEPPPGQAKNGFLALAEYDKASNGGNGDGLITKADAIFGSLRLWQDVNHNGISEAGELLSLDQANVATLELGYKSSKYIDSYGNEFRYRAKVKNAKGPDLGRWAWDVVLARSSSASRKK